MFGLFKRNKPAALIRQPAASEENFMPKPEERCFCGSRKIFSECCGTRKKDRDPPYGIFVFENYFDAGLMDDIVAYAETQGGQRLKMVNHAKSTPDNIVRVLDDRRITERVEMGDFKQQVNDTVRKIYIELADQCFSSQLDWIESPDLMRYRKGGLYLAHADSESINTRTQTWSRGIDRDISMLVYLNNDFEGGELSFVKFNYRLQPKAGMVVVFPSDHRYMHQAERVTDGVRYAIVSWASAKGIEKVSKNPPQCRIDIEW
jgi:hypothetical protein